MSDNIKITEKDLEVRLNDGHDWVKTVISWDRLQDMLKQTGEIHKHERLVTVKADVHGITYSVDKV